MISNIDINKIGVSNKVYFNKKGFKYFIAHKDGRKVIPLCILLPKIYAYWREFDKTKYMAYLIKYDEWLEKYNEVWRKQVSNSIKKGFNSEHIWNENYLKN